ncbi:unnamed protein product [Arabidopsis halleri]
METKIKLIHSNDGWRCRNGTPSKGDGLMESPREVMRSKVQSSKTRQ